MPNAATALSSDGSTKPCITCHDNVDGGAGCTSSGGARPCLNPFGVQFRDASFLWSNALSQLDADGDGFTNGQELQDAEGNWIPGDHSPGVTNYVTRPGFDDSTPGQIDADGDGFCWFGEDLDGSGSCDGVTENTGALDCDDGDDSVNSGAVELCSNVIDDDCNGLTTLEDPACEDVVDRDGDGFCVLGRDLNGDRDCIDGSGEQTSDIDCDDTRITVFPGNRENCTDGQDNDCNGLIDVADTQCRSDVDEDSDGFCPLGVDLNGDGDCLDAGELDDSVFSDGFDCDDQNAAANPDQTEICDDSIDNDCDGDANFIDSECQGFFDADGDGFCVSGIDRNGDGDCIDELEGLADGELGDCNDLDPLVAPGRGEDGDACRDSIDNDCDGSISLADSDCAGYLDTDGDRYCLVGFDANLDGDCADIDEEGGTLVDCDDSLASISPVAVEICTDGLDNDCDGSTDAADPGDPDPESGTFLNSCTDFADLDRDGYCVQGRDLNADFDCADEGELDAAEGLSDSFPLDPTIGPGAFEHCGDGVDNDLDGLVDLESPSCSRDSDADGDGFCSIGRDLNGDGDCLDSSEDPSMDELRFGDFDCDDRDAEVYPANDAAGLENCFDFVDNDCDTRVDLDDAECKRFFDADGDGFCPTGVDDNGDGDCLDVAEDRFGEDCSDNPLLEPLAASINIRAREICDDLIDNDCDGATDLEDTQCDCMTFCDDGDPCTIDGCNEAKTLCAYRPDPACFDAGAPPVLDGDGGTPARSAGGGCYVGGSPRHTLLIWIVGCLGWLILRRRRP
ncbi:MAG: MopE-related protein [Myxococcota bacterium]